MESEKLEVLQQLTSQERQLRRTGKLEEKLSSLPASQVLLRGSIFVLMGEIEKDDKQRREEMELLKTEMRSRGQTENEINAEIRGRYQAVISGKLLLLDIWWGNQNLCQGIEKLLIKP